MLPQLMPDLARLQVAGQRNAQWLVLHARLCDPVSRRQAAAAVNVVKNRIDEAHRKPDRRHPPIVLGKADKLFESQSKASQALLAAVNVLMIVVGLLLLIACANVANLLLARAAGRQKEIGIRLAIGAGRGRLVRQLLTESVLLALMGAAAGLGLAFFAARAVSRLEPPLPLPIVFDFTPDLRVLAFTAAVSVLTGVLFGLAPALRATRPGLTVALKGGEDGGRLRKFGIRDGLVTVQVALSLVLLIGAGLFLRSLEKASSIEIGMQPANVLLMSVDPKLHGYSREQTRQFFQQVRERISTLPGALSVTFVDSVPLGTWGSSSDFRSDGRTTNADIYRTGSRFFETMGIPLLRGRDFHAAADGGDVAVVNQTMAERLFPGEDALGRRVTAGGTAYTVIGIAGNTKSRTLGEGPVACAYLFLEPAADEVFSFQGISVAVKTGGSARSLARAVRGEIAAIDPDLAVFKTETLREHVGRALLGSRLCATLLAIFGTVGLILASAGLYGVMSYSVRRRTREIGIRMALGASARGILALVLRQGLTPAGAGLAAGLALSFALSRFTASMLYGVGTTDTLTFIAVPCLLLAVAAAAALAPARRAAAVEPASALRQE
jgi:predicted permease